MLRRSAQRRGQGRRSFRARLIRTTRSRRRQYFSKKGIPENSEPADAHALRLEHRPLAADHHAALLANGRGNFSHACGRWRRWQRIVVTVCGSAGDSRVCCIECGPGVHRFFTLAARLGAWRFFLGLRTSWMSREILAFGIFAGAAFVATALCWLLPGSRLAELGWPALPRSACWRSLLL